MTAKYKVEDGTEILTDKFVVTGENGTSRVRVKVKFCFSPILYLASTDSCCLFVADKKAESGERGNS